MNRIFKTVFSRTRGAMMVANELTKSHQVGKKAAVAVAVVGVLASASAMAENISFKGVTGTVETSYNDKNKIIGGWNATSGTDFEDYISESSTSLVINSSSTFDDIIGGNHSKTTQPNSSYRLGSTSVVIKNAVTEALVVGGSKYSDSNGKQITGSTYLEINGGTIGDRYADEQILTGMVFAGDILKRNTGAGTGTPDIESTITDTTLKITGGTFNALIFGGSGVQDWYENAGGNWDNVPGALLKAEVTKKASIEITGGTLNENLYLGGYAMAWNGQKSTSSVNEAELKISGTGVVMKGAIYAGGLEEPRTDGVSVGHAAIKISGASVNNIYGYSGHHRYSGPNNIHTFTVNTNKPVATDLTLIDAKATSVLLGEDSKLTVGGVNTIETLVFKNADITGKAAELTVTSADLGGEINLSGALTYNGNIGSFTTMNVTGNVTINGTFDGNVNVTGGVLTAKQDITIAAGKLLMVSGNDTPASANFNNLILAEGDSNLTSGGSLAIINVNDSLTITGNTTVHTGATFTNAGTVTFTGGEFSGKLNDGQTADTYTGAVVIKGDFTNNGELNGKEFTLKPDSTFIAKEDSHDHFAKANWLGGKYIDEESYAAADTRYNTLLCNSGTDYFAGTTFYQRGSDDKDFAVSNLAVTEGGRVFVVTDFSQIKTANVSGGNLDIGDKDTNAVGKLSLTSFTQTGGTTAVGKDSALTTGTLKLSGGSMNVTGGQVSVTLSIETKGGTLSIKDGATLDVTSATLKAESLKGTTVGDEGTVAAYSSQFFANGLGTDGLMANPGAYDSHGLTIDGGTLAIKDAKYNITYVGAAGLAVGNSESIVFTGTLVTPPTPSIPTPDPDPETPDIPGEIIIDDSTGTGSGTGGAEGGTGSTGIEISTDNKVTVEDINKTEGIGNVIMTEVVMSTKKDDDTLTKDDLIIGSANTAEGESEDKTNVIKSNLGVKAVEISATSETVKVNSGKVLTLVGGGDDLIKGSEKDVTLKIGDSSSAGYVQLGVKADGVNNGGTLNTDVEIRQGSVLAVNAGTFEAPKQIKTAGVVTVADNSELKVNNLVVEGDYSSVHVTGSLDVGTLGDKDTTAGSGVIYVGNTESAGSVKVGTSHGGHRFFLDPAFNDKGIDGASNLVYGDAAVVDKILVGENSYAVIGAADDAEFVETFKRSGLTWGADGVKAALFVGQPITINATTGGLTIDGTKTEWTEPAANSVSITNDSVVIADVTKLNAAGAGSLINAGTITVGEKAKAILVNVQSGTEYSLVSNGTGFAADNIVAANAMFGVAAGAGSSSDKAVFDLQGAQSVYGNLMQGQALADAAMQSASSSDAYQYVNGLLTDVNGDIEAAAARFDAAMNPAGTLGVFTTALDRATELTNAVREEAGAAQQPRLWAKVSGGKTKLDGLSTKAQSLDLKTSAYGLIVGGEAPVNGTVLGAAFSAGSGDTKNDSLSGKDEFDYYGLSAYAQREIAGITFTGDIGAAWLSSELTVGAADVKNDADTAVYKLGIEGKKAFDLGSAIVTPFVGLDVYHIKADSYKTNHGVQVASSDATVVEMPIGAQIKGSFETAQGMTVVPSFSFAVIPMFGDKDIDSKVKFAGAENSYNFTFADDVKVRTNFAVNAETKNFRFGAHLGFEWGNEERQSFNGGVKASYLF